VTFKKSECPSSFVPLHPDLKRSIKAAVRGIATDPECEKLLMRELDDLWTYRVRRFRIVYAIDREARVIRLMAIGHRQSIYEGLTAKLRTKNYPAYPINQPAAHSGLA
jgi:mRNA-degrading endonuclease RelE of RelBE toxin-antitoxin system